MPIRLFSLSVLFLFLSEVSGSERPISRGYPFGRRRLSPADGIVADRNDSNNNNIASIEFASSRRLVLRTNENNKESSWKSTASHASSSNKPSIDLFVAPRFSSSTSRPPAFVKKRKPSKEHIPVLSTVEELRQQVLDHGKTLKQVRVRVEPQNFTHEALFDHSVVKLIVQRGKERSKPGHRDVTDTSRLALAIEGGGMRGAVSAGMAAALMCLGLSDSFDTIYGSSAGSVIGAYMVSRQLCMDVYVDILPAAKGNFVCLKRLWKSICHDVLRSTLSQRSSMSNAAAATATTTPPRHMQPGLNTSFILDEIMHPERGVRPLDLQAFLKNNKDQPLRIAATYAENGRLVPHCFEGSDFDSVTGQHDRHGVYACLQASMTVPGAAGPPVRITDADNHTRSFFDAFCCEPLPYRSAVADGATHCLVLCSRPDGYQPKTKPTLYESGIAPTYFNVHGEKELAKFFKKSGQQYLYAEDLMTLVEAQRDRGDGIFVPPPNILYGVERRDEEADYLATHRNEWRKAHLLPIKVPVGTSELPTLEKKRESVLESVRAGFAVVYDIFAPALGLEVDSLTGEEVAKIVFPDGGETGVSTEKPSPSTASPWKRVAVKSARLLKILRDAERDSTRRARIVSDDYLCQVRKVLDSLPGMECESFVSFVDSIRKSHDLV